MLSQFPCRRKSRRDGSPTSRPARIRTTVPLNNRVGRATGISRDPALSQNRTYGSVYGSCFK